MNIKEIQKKIEELNLSVEEVKKGAGVAFRNIRRQETGRTQEAIVAELMENSYPSVTTRTISRWEKNGIPLENIPLISQCLNQPVKDFLPLLFPEQEDDSTPGETQTASENSSSQEISNPFWHNSLFRMRGNKHVILILVAAAALTCLFFYSNRSAIEIIWPLHRIQSHQTEIMGKLDGWYFRKKLEINIQLFVHPLDGSKKYWLNSKEFATVNRDGSWYQLCRFGDEDFRTMKIQPPLDFEVFAVALRKDIEFPLKNGKNHIIAMNESDFANQMKPYAQAVSDKFMITRVKPIDQVPPIVISIKSPLKITWQEQVPMYLQIYHGGEIFREGYYNSADSIDLPPSAILYEIKMGRRKDFPKQNQWVMVENSPNSFSKKQSGPE